MKKILATALALSVALSLAACGKAPTPEVKRTAADYTKMIVDARDEDYNSAYPVIAGNAGEKASLAHNPMESTDENAQSEIEMSAEVTGFDITNCDAYAYSVSLMNIQAYCVGVFRPAQDKAEAVKATLDKYVANQQSAFEHYLPDQYEYTKEAIVRATPSGELILVMGEDADDVAEKIEAALKA
ncbi:MAG: DUF4358 domain-containing protein [Ruthenibacterium sp.]